MVPIERKSVTRPNISFIGNDATKSRSAKRDVRMDKNVSIEADDKNKDMASATTKATKDSFRLNMGIPSF
ncbi:hypothetical protein CTI12_AA202540 [Artemisia annua]|uniref:Uncharacterized protein n=1 Tax=Artemisia annua TaxID=35608 RepID=A0A2U1P265_ARTAN|nr:hypothetical protein CTI12_AA202540 [Artemisia annua]